LRRYLLLNSGWYQAAHARDVALPGVDRFLLQFFAGDLPAPEAILTCTRLTAELAEERLRRPPPAAGSGLPERYEALCDELRADALAADLLLLCLAVRVDSGLGWLVRLLVGEGDSPGLPRRLAEQLLDPLDERGAELAATFAPSSPLFAAGVLQRHAPAGGSERILLAEAALRFFRAGAASLDECPAGALAQESAASCRAQADHVDRLLAPQMAELARIAEQSRLVLLRGTAGKGADYLAAWAAARAHTSLVKAHGPSLLRQEREALDSLAVELLLRRAVLLVDDWPTEEPVEPISSRFLAFLSRLSCPLVLLRVPPGCGERFLARVQVATGAGLIELGVGSAEERGRWWETTLAREASQIERAGWTVLVDAPDGGLGRWLERLRVFPLGVEDMDQALRLALARLPRRSGLEVEDLLEEVEASCRGLVSHRLGELAARVSSTLTWDDVLFPRSLLERFEEVRGYALHFDTLLRTWGFKRKLVTGRGLSVLLSGSSGTGKTTVAALLARDLGLELFQVDLSRVVSKYIGETEERLAQLFAEAAASGAGLLFDEADSLFAGRTDVRSSVDRYANQEVNFLLERVEAHPGVVFLTTNRAEVLDEAFLRRIRFHITFEDPSPQERAKLWRRMIPSETPLARGVRFDELAARFELNPGHIRNAVLRASLRAAARGERLAMQHLVQAARALYQELGKLVREE